MTAGGIISSVDDDDDADDDVCVCVCVCVSLLFSWTQAIPI